MKMIKKRTKNFISKIKKIKERWARRSGTAEAEQRFECVKGELKEKIEKILRGEKIIIIMRICVIRVLFI